MCCLSILVSLMLNIFLSSHAFFAFGWLGFFGIIDVFNFWLSWGWRSSTWRISSSPSSTLGASPSTTTLAPTQSGKQTNHLREADKSPTRSRHIAHGKLSHGQGRSSAQSLPARDNIAQGKLSISLTGSSQHRSQEALNIALFKQCLSSSIINPSIGYIYYLESTVVPKLKPNSGSGDLSPTLGEEVCAPLWCKTSVLLYLVIFGSATKSW